MQGNREIEGWLRNQTPTAHAAPEVVAAATSTNSSAITPELLTDEQGAKLLGTSLRSFKAMQAEAWFPPPVILSIRQKRHIRSELLEAVAKRAPRREHIVEPAPLQEARGRKVICR